MDLLGSILGSMKGPPSIGDDEKKAAKETKVKQQKLVKEQKQKKMEFRKKMDAQISAFCKVDSETKLQCEPMSQVERNVVHEIAEIAGLVSYSFGEEDVDRHLIIWKKEHVPTDPELAAMRAGVEYDPNRPVVEHERRSLSSKTKAKGPEPNSDYMKKYSKIIGEGSGSKLALTVDADKAYGCVPSALKRDHRSIEETMNEIRSRKKPRTSENASTSASSAPPSLPPSDAPSSSTGAAASESDLPSTTTATIP